MNIREFRNEDAGPLLHLFHNTIRTINIKDYSLDQVEAWAPDLNTVDFTNWVKSFLGKYVIVAESKNELAGFGELEPDGHVDRFYIHHRYIGQGLGFTIYSALEERAREDELHRLFVEASITAKPFFERMGFTLVKEQVVERRGVKLRNFVMEKFLK